jgi:hypothetical protein
MKTKTFIIISLILLVIACSTRKPIGYFQPGMTKQDVVKEYGDTPIKTFRTVEGKTFEIWQYDFTHFRYGWGWMTNKVYFVFEGDKIVSTHLQEPPPVLRAIVK